MEREKRVFSSITKQFGVVIFEGHYDGDWWYVAAVSTSDDGERLIGKWFNTDDVLEFIAEHCPERKYSFLMLLPEGDSRRIFSK
jgi:hypothetical protein